jgi:glyoxylase-like metal-dependent hydrolase (beta-lactamase superfamily II)
VPEANVKVLSGGETVIGMRVAYTPGHASHHVCYLHEATGVAFVGDIAAVRIPPSDLIIPPTPPPDIDIEMWEDSIGIVESWQPERLALTHFGAVENPAEHLVKVRKRLREEATAAKEFSAEAYEQRHRDLVAKSVGPETAEELIQCVPPQYQWRGLNRYWTKREERAAASS